MLPVTIQPPPPSPPSQSGENLSPEHNEVSSQYQHHHRHSLPGWQLVAPACWLGLDWQQSSHSTQQAEIIIHHFLLHNLPSSARKLKTDGSLFRSLWRLEINLNWFSSVQFFSRVRNSWQPLIIFSSRLLLSTMPFICRNTFLGIVWHQRSNINSDLGTFKVWKY